MILLLFFEKDLGLELLFIASESRQLVLQIDVRGEEKKRKGEEERDENGEVKKKVDRKTGTHTNDNGEDDEADHDNQDGELDVLPVHLLVHLLAGPLEGGRTVRKGL